MRLKRFLIFLIFLFLNIKANAAITSDFACFYENYIEYTKIPKEKLMSFDLVYEIYKNKFEDFENFINNQKSKQDCEYIFSLISEEYSEFFENLNFELDYIGLTCPNKRKLKKLKRAQNKYLRRLKKCCA